MLKQLQEWFGQAITSQHYETDAKGIISAGPILTADERLAIYHEQYWLRLVDVMRKTFPSLVEELRERFDEEIAIPFLLEHPPQTWALCKLGRELPNWLEGHLSTLAKLDWAAEIAFWEKPRELIDFSTWNEEQMRTQKLYLQPYITLFHLDHDYFAKREGKELQKRECFFVVYRTEQGFAAWKEISSQQHKLLNLFEKGCSIEAACAQIEAGDEIAFWFKDWTLWHFFSSSSPSLV